MQQSLATTFSNHLKIIALHEASREHVLLQLVDGFIKSYCEFLDVPASPTILYEDNTTCITHTKVGYIKENQIKHILPKFFSTHELLGSHMDVRQIR